MSTTRREFLRHATYLAGLGAVGGGGFPESIRRAMAIEPEAGSTFLDAQHVVILMQENRSFDHTFGTLRGVRGLNDPRAITLPDGNPVWVQRNAKGERFLPFRLNINDTKSTWMGSLPHSWTDQVDARNNGRYDRWLDVKHSGEAEFAAMPLTMGYYTRQDIPFYYALADAFTVCDQNFCSSLTGTTPNRLHLWSGTVRARQDVSAPANILNSDVDYGRWADWTTFPERLQDLGVSWKVYQNELSIESGLDGEKDSWLSNFTDNPLEWFSQYGVRFAGKHRAFVDRRIGEIPGEVSKK
ncbi:MAG: phospholipase C, phosphocholine-specific, partial [Planctomycetota bacterium]|nr:phospholipase C, phosphocholine-specific [Planctomycetota bacterium]